MWARKRFKVIYLCSSCAYELSRREVFKADGVCPYCGALSSGQVVNHAKHVVDRKKER